MGHPCCQKLQEQDVLTTALIGAFLAEGTSMTAAAAGVSMMGIAGEIAQERAGSIGMGSFKVELMNALSQMNGERRREKLKIEKE